MKAFRINITDTAKQDIREIRKYITEEFQEPVAAVNTTESILDGKTLF